MTMEKRYQEEFDKIIADLAFATPEQAEKFLAKIQKQQHEFAIETEENCAGVLTNLGFEVKEHD